MQDCSEIETKGVASTADAIEELMHAFEEFKDVNDQRLKVLETRATADVITTEKLARIDDTIGIQQRLLDQIARKSLRPPLGGGPSEQALGSEGAHGRAFQAYVRKGDTGPLLQLETKALSLGSEADGGYLVPDETERTVNSALSLESPVRAMATVRRVTSSVYKRPFAISGAASGWVSETGARTQTGTPGLAELAFPTMELYAMPAATMTLLEDGGVDVEQWLAEEVNMSFAAQESTAFVNGDGNGKPKGFLAYTTVANGSWSWGNVGYVATGSAGAFPATNAADKLVDLIYALKSPYRSKASFAMNRTTQATVRKLKDGDGNYLWQPSASAGQPATLMGFRVAEIEDMPDIAASSNSIAFGDFKRGYLVVDRTGIRVLRDHFSAKPYVLFYTTKRVGGGIQDFNAIKLLKFAAS